MCSGNMSLLFYALVMNGKCVQKIIFTFWFIIGTPCASDPCFNRGSCSNNGSSFFCSCPVGFTGVRCEEEGMFFLVELPQLVC